MREVNFHQKPTESPKMMNYEQVLNQKPPLFAQQLSYTNSREQNENITPIEFVQPQSFSLFADCKTPRDKHIRVVKQIDYIVENFISCSIEIMGNKYFVENKTHLKSTKHETYGLIVFGGTNNIYLGPIKEKKASGYGNFYDVKTLTVYCGEFTEGKITHYRQASADSPILDNKNYQKFTFEQWEINRGKWEKITPQEID